MAQVNQVNQVNQAEFEALWAGVKERPQVRTAKVAQTAPAIQADLSLTGILNQYMAMAANYNQQGKISAQDYADLNTAVDALKTVLARINDSALVAQAVAQNAAALQQKMGSKTS
jgi:hypothetical protein